MFWLLLANFNFWNGDWELGYVSSKVSDIRNIFLFPKILSLNSFGHSWGNSYTKISILDITFRFTCGQSVLYSNIVKLKNMMTMIVWKTFICFLHFKRWLQFLEKTLIGFKKVSSVKEAPICNSRSVLESLSDLNWTWNDCLQQTVRFGLLTQLTRFIGSLKIGEILW